MGKLFYCLFSFIGIKLKYPAFPRNRLSRSLILYRFSSVFFPFRKQFNRCQTRPFLTHARSCFFLDPDPISIPFSSRSHPVSAFFLIPIPSRSRSLSLSLSHPILVLDPVPLIIRYTFIYIYTNSDLFSIFHTSAILFPSLDHCSLQSLV